MTAPWMKYAYHRQGCAALPDDRATGRKGVRRWESHEAMVLDARCTCGLRDAATGQQALNGTESVTHWTDFSFGYLAEDN